MRQAICQYAERAAEKLRQERQYCGQVSAFIKTSTFSKHEPYYSKVSSEQLCIPSRDTRDIIAAAGRALDKSGKTDITMQRRESCSTISVPAELPSYRYLMKGGRMQTVTRS